MIRAMMRWSAYSVVLLVGSTSSQAQVFDLFPTDEPLVISDQLTDTNKVKILRMPDGTLISVFGQGQDVGQEVYDLKARATRDPWDLVLQFSTDEGETWSELVNFDNTAAQSSAQGMIEATGAPPLFPVGDENEGYVNLAADPRAIDYPGDSDKPQVFNAGNNIVISWNSTYCPADAERWPGEEQRFQTYLPLNGITIPYACLWVSRLQWNPALQTLRAVGPEGQPYLTEQITSGVRSVKQDVPVPQPVGFGVIWQEDPLGLQLGNAEGPGTGASGANSTGGTDVWYMHLDTNNNSVNDFIANDWSLPVRVTRNTITEARELQGPLRTSHGPGLYEDGKAAAARPQLRLIGRRAVFAWEEKKSTTGIDDGKYIRYHTITEFTDTSGLPINGCIISRPIENGRRVRILTQPLSAGSTGIVFIYKQGDFAQGGPSDIMLRRAVGGYDPQNIVPAIDVEPTGPLGLEQERCRAHVNNEPIDGFADLDDPLTDIRFGTEHQPAVNFSGTENYGDVPGTAPGVETGFNPYENALAHRGQMRGDQIILGFSHAPDQARFMFLDDAIPYNFYIRSSQDGGETWSAAINVSNLTADSGLSAREPRIVGTPGNGPGCSDPLNPTDPADCANPKIAYFGFGTQTNVTNLEEAEDVDIFMGATQDGGLTFSPVQAVTAGDAFNGITDDDADLETQLKLRPDGLKGFVVWTSTPPGGTDDSLFRRLQINLDRIFKDSFEGSLD
ncbi:MAG: choice-of-anchor O protein [Wenzhouxiangella sp.]|jgi:hypothetical protein|nr:choice-of-anchor O protein [Wenzhouxiangella sp.]